MSKYNSLLLILIFIIIQLLCTTVLAQQQSSFKSQFLSQFQKRNLQQLQCIGNDGIQVSKNPNGGTKGTGQYKVGVYFGNWKIYGRGFKLCQLQKNNYAAQIDRLYYSFLDPRSGDCLLSDPWADYQQPGPLNANCNNANQPWSSDPNVLMGNFYQLQELKKQYPNMKVLASVGGWTYSRDFHKLMLTDASRQRIAKSCSDLIKKYPTVFDGLDIDVEYPCKYGDTNCGDGIIPSTNDKDAFTQLIQQFRLQLGSNYLLTVATSAAPSKADALDFPKLNALLDSYNIMTYDFSSGSWGDTHTGYHTNTYASKLDPQTSRQQYSAFGAADYYVKSGADKLKINIGAAFYGRGYQVDMTQLTATNINSPYLKCTGGLTDGTFETNMYEYYDIQNQISLNPKAKFYDNCTHSAYFFDQTKGRFISFDDENSIREKGNLINKQGYEGIFSWELTGDTNDFALLRAMNYVKNPTGNVAVTNTTTNTTKTTTTNTTTNTTNTTKTTTTNTTNTTTNTTNTTKTTTTNTTNLTNQTIQQNTSNSSAVQPCSNCYGSSSGPCQARNTICYPMILNQFGVRQCPTGTTVCYSSTNNCPNGCVNGICSSGTCVCNQGFTGIACDMKNTIISGCRGCYVGTYGFCRASNNVCYGYMDYGNGVYKCPPETIKC